MHRAPYAESPRPAPIEPRPARGRFWPLLLAALLLGLKLLLPEPETGQPPAPTPREGRTAAPPAAPELPADPEPLPDAAALPAPVQEEEGCPQGCTEPQPGCSIKGNISYKTGERIYHLPWQHFYGKTKINPDYGERWFCTEEEAVANGWRRSQR